MDKTEKRTAEEIPSSLIELLHAHSINTEFVAAADKIYVTSAPLPYFEAACKMYAAQELDAYKAAIKELLPMADHWYDYLKCFENWAKDDNPPPEWFYKLPEYKENLDRARKLIKL